MASITERPKKKGGSSFSVSIRVRGQEPLRGTFESREEADRFIAKEEPRLKSAARKAAKQQAVARTKHPKFATYQQERLRDTLELYAESGEANNNQVVAIKRIVMHCGEVKLGELRRSWVKDYLDKMRGRKTRAGRQFAWQTLAIQLQAMRAACRWRAEELDLDPPDLPFSTSLLPQGWDVMRERRLDADEERLLMARLRKISAPSRYHWRLLVRLALETGARLQELVRSEWREFHIDRRLWIIPADHTKKRTARAVPLSKRATRIAKLLKRLAQPGNPRVFHTLGIPDSVSAGFHKISMDAGLVDFRFHDLRHEAISRMVLYKRQLSVFEIMKIVGHKSIEMLDRYANLRGDELAAKME